MAGPRKSIKGLLYPAIFKMLQFLCESLSVLGSNVS